MAIQRRCPDTGKLRHPDRGSPSARDDYQAALEAHGTTCSMTRRGDCYDNAVMERLSSTVTELGDQAQRCGTARMELFSYTGLFYNPHRRHSTLVELSPEAHERRRQDVDDDAPMDAENAPHPPSLPVREERLTSGTA